MIGLLRYYKLVSCLIVCRKLGVFLGFFVVWFVGFLVWGFFLLGVFVWLGFLNSELGQCQSCLGGSVLVFGAVAGKPFPSFL